MELGHIGAEWNCYLIERDTLGKQLKDCADKEQKMVDVIIALELSWMSVTVCYGNGRFLQIFLLLAVGAELHCHKSLAPLPSSTGNDAGTKSYGTLRYQVFITKYHW